MSKMCNLDESCNAKRGMCIHEKIMLVAVIIMVPLAGHFMFHWF